MRPFGPPVVRGYLSHCLLDRPLPQGVPKEAPARRCHCRTSRLGDVDRGWRGGVGGGGGGGVGGGRGGGGGVVGGGGGGVAARPQAGDAHRGGALGGAAVAQLALVVLTPGEDATVGAEGQAVEETAGDGHH